MRICKRCGGHIDQDESHCHNLDCPINKKPMNEPTTRNITVLNRASVKKYALAVSAGCRASKFSRVGEEFLLRCEAIMEAEIRSLSSGMPSLPANGITFVTKTARDKVEEKLEELAQRIIFNEVARHPSLGCTLK